MPFIGIIARENDCNFVKKTIIKNATANNYEVININAKTIENLKNVKFDVLVMAENVENMLKNSHYLENIINKSDYVIVNSDINSNLLLLKNAKASVITYGFNEKATITVSSVKEDEVMICIQRNIKGLNNKLIEEQEKVIKIKKNNVKKLYNFLVIFTIFEIYGDLLKKI